MDSAVDISRELIFIDTGVEDFQQLLDDIASLSDPSRQIEVVFVDPTRDGIDQITETLSGRSDIDAIHILSHGDGQGVALGNSKLTLASASAYASEIGSWTDVLNSDADILIYGCDLASTVEGQNLIKMLAAATNADVAASEDITGHADLGGDWILEYEVGDVQTDVAFGYLTQSSWRGTLDITTGLVGHYTFDTTPGSVIDSAGNQNATASSGGVVSDADSIVGDRSAEFAPDLSGNSFYQVADNAAQDFGSGAFTVSLWYQWNGTPTSDIHLIGDHDGGGTSAGFRLFIDNGGTLRFERDSGSSTSITGLGPATLDGSWQMVTVSWTGSNLIGYHNAVQGTPTAGIALNVNTTNPLRIGAQSGTTGDFDGRIDDVRLYTRQLSASDINELYTIRNQDYPASNANDTSAENITNVSIGSINNTSGASAGGYGDFTSQSTTITQGESETLSVTIDAWGDNFLTAWVDWNQDFDFEDAGETFVIGTNIPNNSDGPHTVSIVAPTDAALGDTRMRVSLSETNAPSSSGVIPYGEVEDYTITVNSNRADITSGLILHNTFDANANDSSGNNYHGTLTNGALINTSGGTNKIGAGKLSLDGSNDYVDFSPYAANFQGLTQGTISVWVYANADRDVIFELSDSSDVNSRLALFRDADGSFDVFIREGSTTLLDVSTAAGAIAANTWTHVAVTVDASGNKLYVNGVQQGGLTYAVGSATSNQFFDDVTQLDFASWGVDRYSGSSFTRYFAGLLDDGRVYSRALTSSDVTELYNFNASSPQTYIVTNTNDSGVGSLRQAITNANASVGVADTITFSIAGGGTKIIALSSLLPQITDGVTIDGTTQSGYVAGSFLPIIVDGNNLAGDGFYFSGTADSSTLRGLVVRDFGSNAVEIQLGATGVSLTGNFLGAYDSSGAFVSGEQVGSAAVLVQGDNFTIGGSSVATRNVVGGSGDGIVVTGGGTLVNGITVGTISGNYIGLNAAGTATVANTLDGIRLEASAKGVTIGGSTIATRNIISGNAGAGVRIDGETTDGNIIRGNWIGINATGTAILSNGSDGISITGGADNTLIGGSGANEGNWIVSSSGDGIEIDGASTGTIIYGNRIGTDAMGNLNWGTWHAGITITGGASNTTVGGTGAGQANVIAFSGQGGINPYGVTVETSSSTGNTIVGNSIYGQTGIAIDLGFDGITRNDTLDADTGANNLQNSPVISSTNVSDTGTTVTVSGSINTVASLTGVVIHFYATPTGDNYARRDARKYLGSTTVNTDASGNATFNNITLTGYTGTLAAGEVITATATHNNNTSELSQAVVATSSAGNSAPGDLAVVASSPSGLQLNDDGGNDAYLIADEGGSILGGRTSLTYEIQFSSTETSRLIPLASYAVNGSPDEFLMYIGTTGDLGFRVDNTFVGSTAIDYHTLANGERQNLALTWQNNGSWQIFHNGVLIDSNVLASVSSSTGTIADGGKFLIGQEQDSFEGGFSTFQVFTGKHYNARVFSTVRTASEIAASYRSELPHDETGMVASGALTIFLQVVSSPNRFRATI